MDVCQNPQRRIILFVAGVNDGSLGSLIPYVIRTYDIGTNMVAVL
jgi:hypothetical protein